MIASSLKALQNAFSKPPHLGPWDPIGTHIAGLRANPPRGCAAPQAQEGCPRPVLAWWRLTSSSQCSCLRRLAISRGVSPDSLAKRQGDKRRLYNKHK